MASANARALLLALAIAAAAGADLDLTFTFEELSSEEPAWRLYERWSAHHNVVRDPADKARRFDVFQLNARFVHEFNQRGESYWLSLNRFGDMPEAEVVSMYGNCSASGLGGGKLGGRLDGFVHGNVAASNLPAEVDWRHLGAVTAVKDQGRCRSCWAFATVGAVEGIHAIKHGQLVDLSEQELVDCASACFGCDGGYFHEGLAYVAAHGLVEESYYSYIGKTEGCDLSDGTDPTIDGYQLVPPNNVAALMKAVAAQPVAVRLRISGHYFHYYTGGLFAWLCHGGQYQLDDSYHALLVVGYGTAKFNEDCWILKNPWGTKWGDGGYMYLRRRVPLGRPSGLCGILSIPAFLSRCRQTHLVCLNKLSACLSSLNYTLTFSSSNQ